MKSRKLIIYSHGFGVEKTSFGLFTDIQNHLPDYRHILFDYYTHTDNKWIFPGLTEMSHTLTSVISSSKEVYEDITIIAHSQGCTVASLCYDEGVKYIFLAPPTRSITEHFKEHFVSRRVDRASIDQIGNVHMVRKKDSQELVITSDWFDEMVGNESFENMLDIAKTRSLHVIEALEDEDIKDRRRYKKLQQSGAIIHKLNADHNFNGQSRTALLNELDILLRSPAFG